MKTGNNKFVESIKSGRIKIATDIEGVQYATGYGGMGSITVMRVNEHCLHITLDLIEKGHLVHDDKPTYQIWAGKDLRFYKYIPN